MEFDMPRKESSIIKVLGVGGGGSNAVNYMHKIGITGVDFAISNTDLQSLESSDIEIKLQLGPVKTEGRGAGSLPEVGKEACIESIDEVREYLQDGAKMVFITAGLGGGTGTGAAPIIAKAAKDMNILTIAIVTLPFKFEGARRIRQAYEGLEELKKNVDSILVISNDKLRMMYGNLPLSEAFAHADDILSTAARGIAEIITVPGYINVDFEDVNTVMRNSGITVMGSGSAEGESRAKKAIQTAIQSPLLEDNDIRGAKHILLNITSGNKEVTMDEIGEITEYIQGEAGYGTDIIWGNCKDDSLGEKISVTIIATGFDENNTNTQSFERETVKVNLNERDGDFNSNNKIPFDINFDDDSDIKIIDFNESSDDIQKTIDTFKTSIDSDDDSYTIRKREEKLRKIKNKIKNNPHSDNQQKVSLDNPNMINKYENEPAYKRRQVKLEEKNEKFDPNSPSFKIGIDEDEPIQRNNTYLHDNVD